MFNLKFLTIVACVAGKYYDLDERKCKYCPVGTYTQIPGRLGCSSCPKGKTTPGVGTSKATECRGQLTDFVYLRIILIYGNIA